jgi:hypothetical protein
LWRGKLEKRGQALLPLTTHFSIAHDLENTEMIIEGLSNNHGTIKESFKPLLPTASTIIGTHFYRFPLPSLFGHDMNSKVGKLRTRSESLKFVVI